MEESFFEEIIFNDYRSAPYYRQKRGLIQPIWDGAFIGIRVDYLHLFRYGVFNYLCHRKIAGYFAAQGFAMAIPLPYEYKNGGIVITKCMPLNGFFPATINDGIPF